MVKKTPRPACGADVLRAIRDAYPGNMVTDDVICDESSYYDGGIRDAVRKALCGVKADLLYDRPPEGRPHWDEGADPEEDPPDWVEEPASYDLLFLALRGEQFEFEGDLPQEDFLEGADEMVLVTNPTVGRIGCAVGISSVAPFATIRFTEMEFAENGISTMPDIWPHIYNLDGSESDVEAHYEELFLEEGIAALRDLREEIVGVLGALGIGVLSTQELQTPIPGLKPEPARNIVLKRKVATVGDALFFQTV